MSGWFKQKRMEFITATLRQFGQVRRADIVREFNVTLSLATMDIADYLATNSHVYYDVSAKVYVLKEDVAP